MAMTDQEYKGGKYSAPSGQTFDQLVALKAQRQKDLIEARARWRDHYASMTYVEREDAEHRFRLAFEGIANQFGKSRRLILDEDG